jgi:hypothetical protein
MPWIRFLMHEVIGLQISLFGKIERTGTEKTKKEKKNLYDTMTLCNCSAHITNQSPSLCARTI